MKITLEKRSNSEINNTEARFSVLEDGKPIGYLTKGLALDFYPEELAVLEVKLVREFLTGMKEHGILEHTSKVDLDHAIANILN